MKITTVQEQYHSVATILNPLLSHQSLPLREMEIVWHIDIDAHKRSQFKHFEHFAAFVLHVPSASSIREVILRVFRLLAPHKYEGIFTNILHIFFSSEETKIH